MPTVFSFGGAGFSFQSGSDPSLSFVENGVQFTFSTDDANGGDEFILLVSGPGTVSLSDFNSGAGGAFTLTVDDLSGLSNLGGSGLQLEIGATNGDWDVTFLATNGTGNNVQFTDVANTTLSLGMTSTNFSGIRFTNTGGGDGIISVQSLTVDLVCFREETQIATPAGDVMVEDLAIGDLVRTADGREVAVKWVGRQTITKTFAGPKADLVCLKAGCLGKGAPHTDLYVTGDHGMVLDGMIVNASALVNHKTIRWVPSGDLPERYTVYHIETEDHDVILANGAPSETYLDARARSVFDNFQEYLDLYGTERIIPEMQCPRISSQRLLPAGIRARLMGEDGDMAKTG